MNKTLPAIGLSLATLFSAGCTSRASITSTSFVPPKAGTSPGIQAVATDHAGKPVTVFAPYACKGILENPRAKAKNEVLEAIKEAFHEKSITVTAQRPADIDDLDHSFNMLQDHCQHPTAALSQR